MEQVLNNETIKKMTSEIDAKLLEYENNHKRGTGKSAKIQEKLDKITATLKDKGDRAKVLETYINDLKASKNKLDSFDERIFYALVDKIKVNKN